MSVQVKVESMTFSYRKDVPLFDAASADIIPESGSARGFITVVMGASGTGKSTLLKLLLGDTQPASGRIVITPVDARVAYLSQDPVLFDHLSIQDNARYFERLRSTRAHFDPQVFEFAQRTLGLTEVLARNETVRSLSGGERQRIALLRSISIRPALLLLDEPCRGLDPAVRQQFLLYLRQLVDRFAISVIYVTHHAHEAKLLADHLVFLVASATRKARVLEGSLADFIAHPRQEAVAHTFADTPLNRFAVTFNRHGVVKLLDKVYSMAPLDPTLSTGEREQQAFMLFPASSVQWNGEQGIACRGAGRTGTYVLANLDSSAPASSETTVVGPMFAGDVRCFDVTGEVLLFDADGSFIGKGPISATRHTHGTSRGQIAS